MVILYNCVELFHDGGPYQVETSQLILCVLNVQLKIKSNKNKFLVSG